jgi:hypothetical protein
MNSITVIDKTMRRWTLRMAAMTALALAIVVAFGPHAEAQTVPLTGKIVSASSTNGTIFTTPQSGTKFVLTQWCTNIAAAAPGEVVLFGSSFGFIAMIEGLYSDIGNAGQASCVSFSPGYVMPFRETISCTNLILVGTVGLDDVTIPCSISGVASPTVP